MKHFLASLCLLLSAAAAQAQQTTFTFQGRLDSAGAPATGLHDLRVTPYDAASGGAALAATTCLDNVTLDAGLFTIELPSAFAASGSAYLEVQVRADAAGMLACNNTSGFTPLAPRHAVTPAPTAAYAFAFPAQSNALAGAVRYNTDLARFEGFVGGFWTPFLMGDPLAPTNIQVFNSAGTTAFVVPAGVTSIGADVWGGGGGGGGLSPVGVTATTCPMPTNSRGGGGGGGSGTFARVTFPVTPGETLIVTVGSGGSGSGGANGIPGSLSRILRGATVLVSCPGGAGGNVGSTHNNPSSPQPSGFGGSGGTAPTAATGVTLTATLLGNTGGIGMSPYCAGAPFPSFQPGSGGAAAGARVSPSPLPTSFSGGGGLGAAPTAATGGSGSPGQVRFFWY
jgi:hypothetical protein